MARVGDASASSVVTADAVTLAARIEGYLQYGKLAPGGLLDNDHPVATIHDPLVDRLTAAQTRARVSALDGELRSLLQLSRGLEALRGRFEKQSKVYQSRRAEQLSTELSRRQATLTGQEAKRDEAAARLKRFATLADEGVASARCHPRGGGVVVERKSPSRCRCFPRIAVRRGSSGSTRSVRAVSVRPSRCRPRGGRSTRGDPPASRRASTAPSRHRWRDLDPVGQTTSGGTSTRTIGKWPRNAQSRRLVYVTSKYRAAVWAVIRRGAAVPLGLSSGARRAPHFRRRCCWRSQLRSVSATGVVGFDRSRCRGRTLDDTGAVEKDPQACLPRAWNFLRRIRGKRPRECLSNHQHI
jgi:hypothetical protein